MWILFFVDLLDGLTFFKIDFSVSPNSIDLKSLLCYDYYSRPAKRYASSNYSKYFK